jgi:hypothetical protein
MSRISVRPPCSKASTVAVRGSLVRRKQPRKPATCTERQDRRHARPPHTAHGKDEQPSLRLVVQAVDTRNDTYRRLVSTPGLRARIVVDRGGRGILGVTFRGR